MADRPFLLHVSLKHDQVVDPSAYPFVVPAVRALDGLPLASVTYFVGENGSGKSTLLEAIAVAAGFNAEGGTSNFAFSTRATESPLHGCIRLARSERRPRTGFFLRAESFYNVASEIDRLGVGDSYGEVGFIRVGEKRILFHVDLNEAQRRLALTFGDRTSALEGTFAFREADRLRFEGSRDGKPFSIDLKRLFPR